MFPQDFRNSPKKVYLKHEFGKVMRELKKCKKKNLLKVKSQVELLAFGAYMLESLQSFNNSQSPLHDFYAKPTANMSKMQNLCH